MPHPDLETIVHRALSELPVPRAPRTLVPRVMAGLRHSRHAWYQRAWRTWPAAARVASLAALAAVVWASLLALPAAQEGARALVMRMGVEWNLLSTVTAGVGAIIDVADVLQRVSAPAIGYVVSLTMAMCAAFAVCGAALTRVVLGGSSEP